MRTVNDLIDELKQENSRKLKILGQRAPEFVRRELERPIYAEISEAILIGIPDRLLFKTLNDAVWIHCELRGKEATELPYLSGAFHEIDAALWLERELLSGGFYQYYSNLEAASGDALVEATRQAQAGLQRIGAKRAQDLFKKSQALWTKCKSAKNKDAVLGRLNDLSDSYNGFDENDTILEHAVRYVRKSPRDFVLPAPQP